MPCLEFAAIGKAFPGVKALSDVRLAVEAGRVHGLLGENGAGKSTLLKILGGEYRPDEGELLIDGRARRFASSAEAIGAGVAIIHQELQYVAELTVTENLLLGRLPARWGFVQRRAADAWVRAQLQQLGVALDPDARLAQLSIGQRQMVEICKAILRDARIIALDEPTSSLSHGETAILFRLVRRLKAEGKALIYISHRLEEIFELCDSATVLRDGRSVASFAALNEVTPGELVRQMVGREVSDIYDWRPRAAGAPRLQVQGLRGDQLPEPASFEVRGGEIVGFFGLVGAGRSELMRLVYGADRRRGGSVAIDGVALAGRSVGAAIGAGLVYCPEDRKEEGVVGCRSVAENINISCRRHSRRWRFFTDDRAEARVADAHIAGLRIKTPSRSQEIRRLSGGNQQKAILARWLAEKDLRVLIIDEPTRGIDVGAKNEIYQILYRLAARGVAIVVVSSELPEVMGIADRIVVMCGGRISGVLPREAFAAASATILQLALPAERSPAAANAALGPLA